MKEFFKTGRFRVLLVVGCLLFSFLLRSIYTGGLMPLLSSAGGMLMVPLNSMSAAGAAIQNRFGPFLSSGEVHRENQALREEIQRLEEQLIDYETVKMENEQFRELLEIKERNSDLIFEPATVVGRTPDDWFGSFTIDVGTYHGVSLRCPVITSDGLVGIVSEVGRGYSKVQTILDASVSIGGVDIHTLDTGIITGTIPLAQEGSCKLGFLPRESGVTPGDTIVTSGTGGLLPRGLIVGEIQSVEMETSGLSLYAVITPAADIQGARQVFVITDFGGKDDATATDSAGEEE
ncbi:MAG: rod shape-determining protein MreC [Angelakisella sp.]|nr:rod shape-determining protein MreC [Angelakisella sp.]